MIDVVYDIDYMLQENILVCMWYDEYGTIEISRTERRFSSIFDT